MNELSFEDFFSAGTGAEIKEEKFVISSEGFDGYSDALLGNAEQALEDLNFLDSFEAVSRMNAETQIRMLKKIKNNYNSKTIGRENLGFSIESFCDTRIQSLEDAVAAPKTEGKTQQKPKDLGKEHKGFFKTIWEGIKNVFKAIGDFFAEIGRGIAKFFSRFKKASKDVDPATIAEVTKGVSSEEKTVVQAAAKAAVVNAIIDNNQKFKTYSERLQKIAEDVSKAAETMANADAGKYGDDFSDLQKSVAQFLKKSAKIQMFYGKAFGALSAASVNTVKANKFLEQWSSKDNKLNEGKSASQAKLDGLKRFLKPGDMYILNGNINTSISEQLIRKSDALNKGIRSFTNGTVTEQHVVELRKISEEINKLVLGDKANYDISTIDEKAYTVEKLFGAKVLVIKGAKTAPTSAS